jgi:hypothetical protein
MGAHQSRVAERRQMIGRSHPLSVKCQAEFLKYQSMGCVLLAQANQQQGSGVDGCDRQVALGLPVHGLESTA